MDPLQVTPAAPTVIEAVPIVQPAQPTQLPAPAPAIPSPVSEPIFGSKLEVLQIGLIALVSASYIMSIFYYRKAIETSNSYQKLQAQINQMKVSMQPSKS